MISQMLVNLSTTNLEKPAHVLNSTNFGSRNVLAATRHCPSVGLRDAQSVERYSCCCLALRQAIFLRPGTYYL